MYYETRLLSEPSCVEVTHAYILHFTVCHGLNLFLDGYRPSSWFIPQRHWYKWVHQVYFLLGPTFPESLYTIDILDRASQGMSLIPKWRFKSESRWKAWSNSIYAPEWLKELRYDRYTPWSSWMYLKWCLSTPTMSKWLCNWPHSSLFKARCDGTVGGPFSGWQQSFGRSDGSLYSVPFNLDGFKFWIETLPEHVGHWAMALGMVDSAMDVLCTAHIWLLSGKRLCRMRSKWVGEILTGLL